MRRPITSAITIALVHSAIVASLAVQYEWDRRHLPRAWVRARPEAVAHPIAGRYLQVPVSPTADAPILPEERRFETRVVFRHAPAALEVRGDRLVARPVPASHVNFVYPHNRKDEEAVLWPPLEYFVPRAAGEPSRLLAGGELWLEVSVPPQGAPRVLRAGRMRDGKIEPFDF